MPAGFVVVVPVFQLFQQFYKKIEGNYILTLLGKCWNSWNTGTLEHTTTDGRGGSFIVITFHCGCLLIFGRAINFTPHRIGAG